MGLNTITKTKQYLSLSEYLNTEKWKIKAKEAKNRVHWRCQVCNKEGDNTTLHAHHRTYERLGNELPDDITVLCEDCHAKFHTIIDDKNTIEIIEQAQFQKPLTDQEIYYMALLDWYSILESLWTAIGKPVEKKRMLIYGKDLGNVPCELLERAIKRIRMNSIYTQVPTIGEIWQAVKMELAADNCTTPEEWIERKWIRFMGRIQYPEVVHER